MYALSDRPLLTATPLRLKADRHGAPFKSNLKKVKVQNKDKEHQLLN